MLCPQKLFRVVDDLFFFTLLPDSEVLGDSKGLNVLIPPTISITMFYVCQPLNVAVLPLF
jgi:hypothetical protein